MKITINFLLSIIIISGIIAFSYLYYIKPQRKFIEVKTQECIKEAMRPIDTAVAEYEYGTYKTKEDFDRMVKAQNIELNLCIAAYNSLIFSKPEKDFLKLNLNKLITSQYSKINEYSRR